MTNDKSAKCSGSSAMLVADLDFNVDKIAHMVLDNADIVMRLSDLITHEILYTNKKSKEIFGDTYCQCYWHSVKDEQLEACVFCGSGSLIDLHGRPIAPLVWEFKSSINDKWYHIEDSAIELGRWRLVHLEIAVDITKRKQSEEDLRSSKEAAEIANVTKNQFLAMMSHEIRMPMNGVIGVIQLLEMTKLSNEQREYVEIAKSSGFKLVHLLNDILDISKVEAGKLELEFVDFDLQSLISKAISLMSVLADEKGVRIIVSFDHNVPFSLKGDPVRLHQIITNLVGNAIKFTKKGCIKLNIVSIMVDKYHAKLRFEIIDNGPGIDSQQLSAIFEPFVQGDATSSRRFGGAGLGLAICKQLVTLMGGEIGVASEIGSGSTFFFTIVFELCNNEKVIINENHFRDESCGHGFRILLAEDDVVAQKIVSKLLGKYGYEVDSVSNGSVALLALQKKEYAIVLMDCMMPGMNGFEATSKIRDKSSAVLQHDIPIIALTGNATRDDIEYCKNIGMDDHLSKPVLLENMLTKIDALLLKAK